MKRIVLFAISVAMLMALAAPASAETSRAVMTRPEARSFCAEWWTLTRGDYTTSFKSKSSCVAYAIRGGVLTARSQFAAWCQTVNGVPIMGFDIPTLLWTCDHLDVPGTFPVVDASVLDACIADGGQRLYHHIMRGRLVILQCVKITV